MDEQLPQKEKRFVTLIKTLSKEEMNCLIELVKLVSKDGFSVFPLPPSSVIMKSLIEKQIILYNPFYKRNNEKGYSYSILPFAPYLLRKFYKFIIKNKK